MKLLLYFLFLLALVSMLVTAVSMIPSGEWWMRIFDFPRVQIFWFSLFLFVLVLIVGSLGSHLRAGDTRVILLLLILVVLYQGYCILPFTPLSSVHLKQATTNEEERPLSLLIANLYFELDNHDLFIELVENTEPDCMLVTELDEDWDAAFASMMDRFPYSIKEVRGKGHGIGFYSKYPLKQSKVQFLVSDERPSIYTEMYPEDEPIVIWGLHPAPPGIKMSNGERKDSDPRDSELLQVAKKVAQDGRSTLVLGDFNDTAWSFTTELFKDISGLEDPRVGRGVFATYHTKYPLFRYPIDHVFASSDFRVHKVGRLSDFGSDHFPMYVRLQLPEQKNERIESAESSSSVTLGSQAEEIIEIGEEKAEEYEKYKEVPLE